MTALLKVSSCDKSTSDYYEEIYEDIPTQLVNDNNVIEPRSFFQNSNHPNTRKKFKATTILENYIEKIEPQFGETAEWLKVQSVSSSDLLMLLGQSHPTPHGLSLSDDQEPIYEAIPDDHSPDTIDSNEGPSKVTQVSAEPYQSRKILFNPEPGLQSRSNKKLETTIEVKQKKLDLQVSSLPNNLMTTILSDNLTAISEKTDDSGSPDRSVHYVSKLSTIAFGKKPCPSMGSHVPLSISGVNSDSNLLDTTLMNNQSSTGDNMSSMDSDRLLKEKRFHGIAFLAKDNTLFKDITSLMKINKTYNHSATNKKAHIDSPTSIENSTAVLQDTILKINSEIQELTSLIHDGTLSGKNTTYLGLNHMLNKTASSKNKEIFHQKDEDPVPQDTENTIMPFSKILFLSESENWMKQTNGNNSLISEQGPSPKQLVYLMLDKSMKNQNFLSEKNKMIVAKDEFTKDTGLKHRVFPSKTSIFLTTLANVQENDMYNQEKDIQKEIEKKASIKEKVVLPQVHIATSSKNFLKDIFSLGTRQKVSLDGDIYIPIRQDIRSINNSTNTVEIHMVHFFKRREDEETNSEGLVNKTRETAKNYPSQKNIIALRSKRTLGQFRLPLEEMEIEKQQIVNNDSTLWPQTMNYLTQIDHSKEGETSIIQSSLSESSMTKSTTQTNSSGLHIVKASAFPPTDLRRIPFQDKIFHVLASSYTYDFKTKSSRIQESSHFLKEIKINNSSLTILPWEMIINQGKFASPGTSNTNSVTYKKLGNIVLFKPVLSEESGKVELLPQVLIHEKQLLPTKTSHESPGHLDLIKEVFLQKTRGPIKWDKAKRNGKSLKGTRESSEKTPSKLLDNLAWDNHHAAQIPKDKWKSKEKSPEITSVKREDTILSLNPHEDNHSVVANEKQKWPQIEASLVKQGQIQRLYSQNAPVLKRHQRELSALQSEQEATDYDDSITIETNEDFDIYGENIKQDPRSFQQKTRHYFIAAVERLWDYGMSTSPHVLQNRFVSIEVFSYAIVTFDITMSQNGKQKKVTIIQQPYELQEQSFHERSLKMET